MDRVPPKIVRRLIVGPLTLVLCLVLHRDISRVPGGRRAGRPVSPRLLADLETRNVRGRLSRGGGRRPARVVRPLGRERIRASDETPSLRRSPLRFHGDVVEGDVQGGLGPLRSEDQHRGTTRAQARSRPRLLSPRGTGQLVDAHRNHDDRLPSPPPDRDARQAPMGSAVRHDGEPASQPLHQAQQEGQCALRQRDRRAGRRARRPRRVRPLP